MTQISTSDYLRLLKYRKSKYFRVHHASRHKSSNFYQSNLLKEEEILFKSKLDKFESESGRAITTIHNDLKENDSQYQNNLRMLHKAAEQLKNQFTGSGGHNWGQSTKLGKNEYRNLILKAKEKEAIFNMKQRAATIIQTCFKRYKAQKIHKHLKMQKNAGFKILELLRQNVKSRQFERNILHKARVTASAYKLTSFFRKVADWNRRDKHYKKSFDKIKGLLYGYKLRRILELEKMQDLKFNIQEIEMQIDECETRNQKQKLEHELLYQKKVFCNMISRFWEKGFSEPQGKNGRNSTYKPDYLTQTLIQGAAKTAKRVSRMNSTLNNQVNPLFLYF